MPETITNPASNAFAGEKVPFPFHGPDTRSMFEKFASGLLYTYVLCSSYSPAYQSSCRQPKIGSNITFISRPK
jgi:hypothetical protein